MTAALKALGGGLARVVASPQILVAAFAAMLIIAAPFTLVVAADLKAALNTQPPVNLDAGEIDPEWWFEYRQHAAGLAGTFAPSIIGFAAPLDNLSRLFDGTGWPLILAAPYLLAIVVWSFLWGAALERFAHGSARRGFLRAGGATFVRFLVISVLAAAAVILLYVTLHPLLFKVILPGLGALEPVERTAFLLRVAMYGVFGAVLGLVGLIADYARVAVVLTGVSSPLHAVREGAAFVRRHFGAAVTLYLLTGLLFAALLAVYGYVDVYGGSRVMGWRGIAIAQAYIVARLTIRLAFGASEIRLYRMLTDQPAS